MSERQNRTFEVWRDDDRDWSMKLVDFIADLTEALNSVPEPYRSEATIELDVDNDYYGGSTFTFRASYERPETDREYADRMTENALRLEKQAAAIQTHELMELTRLAAKYGMKFS